MRDLIQLDYLGDIGISEMIGLMRLHVLEVTRFTALIGLNIQLTETHLEQFNQDCRAYGLDSAAFLAGNKFSPTGLLLLKVCAKVHDIGKPFFKQIYSLERSLTAAEFEHQKLHANFSRIIVKSWLMDDSFKFENPGLVKFVADMAAAHQEKYDGSGYPDGLQGDAIGLVGRILAVADAISAMVNRRPYQPSVSLDTTSERLQAAAGSHFDPSLIELILPILGHGKYAQQRIMGDWSNTDGFSEEFLHFLEIIDLDEVELAAADRSRLEELREIIRMQLAEH